MGICFSNNSKNQKSNKIDLNPKSKIISEPKVINNEKEVVKNVIVEPVIKANEKINIIKVKQNNEIKDENLNKPIKKPVNLNVNLEGINEKNVMKDTPKDLIVNENEVKVEEEIIIKLIPQVKNENEDNVSNNKAPNLENLIQDEEFIKEEQNSLINENDNNEFNIINLTQFDENKKTNFNFNFSCEIPLNINDFSYENDYTFLLKKCKVLSKSSLVYKILNLKERQWTYENFLLSDKIKKLNFNTVNKFTSSKAKLHEHFNWLLWAISEFFFSCYVTDCTYEFTPSIETKVKASTMFDFKDDNVFINSLEDYGLPNAESIEWLKGFEWKGIFIRLVTYEEFKNTIMNELDAMRYCFFEYLTLLESGSSSIFSEIVFPLFSYCKISNLVIYCSSLSTGTINETNDKLDLSCFSKSGFLNKLTKKNLLKVVSNEKSKYIITNCYDLVPELISFDKEFLHIPANNFESTCFLSKNNIKESFKNKLKLKTNFLENLSWYENSLPFNIKSKIFYSKNSLDNYETSYEKIKKNSRVEDFFVGYMNMHIQQNLNFYEIESNLFNDKKKQLADNQILEICGNCIALLYHPPIKQKFSLLSSSPKKQYIHLSKLLENFLFVINNCSAFHIEVNTLENLNFLMEKYGINNETILFLIKGVKNNDIKDLLKIKLFLELTNEFFSLHEGLNFELKFHLNNQNLVSNNKKNIILSDFFNFSKEKKLFNYFRNKIYLLVQIILKGKKTRNIKSFEEFFFKQISFLLNLKFISTKMLDEQLKISSFNSNISFNNLLTECIESCYIKPFLFINSLEEVLGIKVNYYKKFKLSMSIDSFLEDFNELDIESEAVNVNSYFNLNEIGYYMLVKCFSSDSKQIKEIVNEIDDENLSMKKKNFIPTFQKNELASLKKVEISTPKSKTPLSYDEQKIKWEELSEKFELRLPSILYRLKLKDNINSTLLNSYTITSLEILKDWKILLEFLYQDNYSHRFEEQPLLLVNFLLFINSFFIEEDSKTSKEILSKLRDMVKNTCTLISLEVLAVLNYFDGVLTEKKNLIECENQYSQALILSLLLNGDPRGRGTLSKFSLNTYIWKISRHTTLFENFLVNENFKELFHCNDFFCKKAYLENNCLIANSTLRRLFCNTSFYSNKFTFYNKEISNSQFISKYNFSKKQSEEEDSFCLMEGIDEDMSLDYIKENHNFELRFSTSNYVPVYVNVNEKEVSTDLLLNKGFIEEISAKFSFYDFPAISEMKSNNEKFYTKEFILFLLKYVLDFSNKRTLNLEESIKNIGIDFTRNTNNGQEQSVRSGKTVSTNVNKKKKNQSLINEILLDKLSHKKHLGKGLLVSFGNNQNNETSHTGYESLYLPRFVYKLKDIEIRKVVSGWEHNCAITQQNEIYIWGNNDGGQCGISSEKVIFNPTKIEQLKNCQEVSCGNDHTIAICKVNDVNRCFSWGRSEGGVLGYSEQKIEYYPKEIKNFPEFDEKSEQKIITLVCGSLHNVCLVEEYEVLKKIEKDKYDSSLKIDVQEKFVQSKLYTWGFGEGGQLGHTEKYLNINAKKRFIISPTEINISNMIKSNLTTIEALNVTVKIKKISCGEAHCLALTNLNEVWGWGLSNTGQLGLGFCEDSFETGKGINSSIVFTPRKISFPDTILKTGKVPTYIQDIQAGKTFSTFISDKFQLFVCGVNDLFQLGIETPENNSSHLFNNGDIYNSKCNDIVKPVQVECFFNMRIKNIACGESHCIAIIEEDSGLQAVWAWGSNQYGQLGIGVDCHKSLPKPINYLLNFTDDCAFLQVECGAFHSFVLLSSKKISKDDKKSLTLSVSDNNHDTFVIF